MQPTKQASVNVPYNKKANQNSLWQKQNASFDNQKYIKSQTEEQSRPTCRKYVLSVHVILP